MNTLDDYMHALMADARAARESEPMRDVAMRHLRAWNGSHEGYERAIVRGLQALAEYAFAYEQEFGGALAGDYILGAAFAQQLRGWRVLLNGNIGRLDGGFLDAAAQRLWTMAGFTEEL